MTIQELISICANNVGDSGFTNAPREAYIAWANDVAHELWMSSKAVHRVREYTLPENEYFFEIPDRDILQFAGLFIRSNTVVPQTDPPVYDPSTSQARAIEKPIYQNVEENLGVFKDIGALVEEIHVTPELREGKWLIHSPRKFGQAVLVAYCVIHAERYVALDIPAGETDADEADLSDSQIIWEPLRNLFIEGVTWRAARRHIQWTKDQTRQSLWSDAQNLYYSRHLPNAIHYIHSLKDGTAALHVRPFRWLEE